MSDGRTYPSLDLGASSAVAQGHLLRGHPIVSAPAARNPPVYSYEQRDSGLYSDEYESEPDRTYDAGDLFGSRGRRSELLKAPVFTANLEWMRFILCSQLDDDDKQLATSC